jgi:hypothetical protein
MKRTRHKRTPSVRRRALEIIAAHPDGCTEAILAAENIPADLLIELVRGGLVMARSELLDDEDGGGRGDDVVDHGGGRAGAGGAGVARRLNERTRRVRRA